jgi:hypothetical protein
MVLGGGNAKFIRRLAPGVRIGNNLTAFRGGLRLWNLDDIPTQSDHGDMPERKSPSIDWRIV